ncbi:MAG: NADH:ubiquinone oxidoreductase subunit NDUFA12 [Sphingomonadaceae bacterium]|nr:NADH:ubiquinone oxidoreductase subunit NDUFA12 [Sphingomonadaceae bacterium]
MALGSIFTWWHGPGLGTRLTSWRTGREVGRDGYGNVYFESKRGRRWVIYNGEPEASRVPPEWQLWLRRTVDATPDRLPLKPRVWEKPWVPNPTGTPAAHRPSGSLAVAATRAKTTGDYEAWTPDA